MHLLRCALQRNISRAHLLTQVRIAEVPKMGFPQEGPFPRGAVAQMLIWAPLTRKPLLPARAVDTRRSSHQGSRSMPRLRARLISEVLASSAAESGRAL